MKRQFELFRSLPAQPMTILERLMSRRNARLLFRLLVAFGTFVLASTVIFHYLMALEGQRHSWFTGLYWTFTTMTTLGLGDIAFASDIGRIFTVIVLVSGVVFLLAILPFTMIQLFQSTARIPRELPLGTTGHVVLTQYGPVTSALIAKLIQYEYPYVLVVPDVTQAGMLRDRGIRAVVGELDDSETYRQVRADGAVLVTATASDIQNTGIVHAVRQASRKVHLVSTSTSYESQEIMKLAGATHVVRLDELMGQSLARRTIAGDAMAHVIGEFNRLVIAEATAAGTPLVGKTLREAQLRTQLGLTVVGVWEQGEYRDARPETRIGATTVLVMAGTQNQVDRYNELFCIYHVSDEPVVIVGGGNVGRAMGHALAERGIRYHIVEQTVPERKSVHALVHGDATDPDVLRQAGILKAPAVAITTHNDDVNIYVTGLCRYLRPDIQIISRATHVRSIRTLTAAGCDFVMSYASMGSNIIFNLLNRGDILMLAEGLDVFVVTVPKTLVGKNIRESRVRSDTGCTIIGVSVGGQMTALPEPETILPESAKIVLLGSVASEKEFLKRYRLA
jgi:voltage-gated potassium channel